jgi:hypothetical protein
MTSYEYPSIQNMQMAFCKGKHILLDIVEYELIVDRSILAGLTLLRALFSDSMDHSYGEQFCPLE